MTDQHHTFDSLFAVLATRAAERPEGSSTVAALDAGVHTIGKKVLEEAGEVVMAAKDQAHGTADRRRVAEEAGDLVYHLLVLLAEREISLEEVMAVLEERAG